MQPATYLIGNGRLITQNPKNPFLDNGCVVTSGDKILDFGTTEAMKSIYEGEFIDAKGGLIMPSFINMHMHIYSAMARGMKSLSPTPNKNFDDILKNLWWKLDETIDLNDVRYSAYATYIDGIKNGVTTVFDHHASYAAITGSLKTIAEVASELGVRTSLCFEVSDRNGEDKAKAAIAENADFISYAETQNPEMLGAMMGLHASFTVSEKTLAECVQAANGAGFHVHCAEGSGDEPDSISKYGMSIIERFEKAGVLGEKSLAVHCIHINNAERTILAQSKTPVIHNPQSNMGNAVGCANIPELYAAGVLCGLGTDGYTANMLESMKAANLIHKHVQADPSIMWGEPPQMLFKNNRTIANRHFGANLGIIAKGSAADVIIINYDPLTPMNAENVNGHLHFGVQGSDVDTTIAAGKILMRNRKLLVCDEHEIMAKSRELARQLWGRV